MERDICKHKFDLNRTFQTFYFLVFFLYNCIVVFRRNRKEKLTRKRNKLTYVGWFLLVEVRVQDCCSINCSLWYIFILGHWIICAELTTVPTKESFDSPTIYMHWTKNNFLYINLWLLNFLSPLTFSVALSEHPYWTY